MKALLYKEFKLAMHPVCYAFIFLFPLMALIPAYPLGIGFIYVLSCYPILFLGANKGQQSNDLLFSTLLPVRKKDIVLARIITVAFMQFVFIAMMAALYPVSSYIHTHFSEVIGISLKGFMTLVAFAIIGYAVSDLIFFPIYYRRGKSIVGSTLATIFGFIAYICITTIALPYIITSAFTFLYDHIWVQVIILVASLVVYFLIHIAVYKISSKKLERVDF